MPLVSTTPVVNKDSSKDCEKKNVKHFFHLPLLSVEPVYSQSFEKIQNVPIGIIRGRGDVLWKKPEVKNLVTLSLYTVELDSSSRQVVGGVEKFQAITGVTGGLKYPPTRGVKIQGK